MKRKSGRMVFLMYNIKIDTEKYLYLIEARDKIKFLRGTSSINQLHTAVQAVLDTQCLNVDWSGPVQPIELKDVQKCLSNWCLAVPVQLGHPSKALIRKAYSIFRAARPLSDH